MTCSTFHFLRALLCQKSPSFITFKSSSFWSFTVSLPFPTLPFKNKHTHLSTSPPFLYHHLSVSPPLLHIMANLCESVIQLANSPPLPTIHFWTHIIWLLLLHARQTVLTKKTNFLPLAKLPDSFSAYFPSLFPWHPLTQLFKSDLAAYFSVSLPGYSFSASSISMDATQIPSSALLHFPSHTLSVISSPSKAPFSTYQQVTP